MNKYTLLKISFYLFKIWPKSLKFSDIARGCGLDNFVFLVVLVVGIVKKLVNGFWLEFLRILHVDKFGGFLIYLTKIVYF